MKTPVLAHTSTGERGRGGREGGREEVDTELLLMVYSLARLAGEDGACDTREMVWEIMNGVDRHTPAPNTPVYSNSCEENNNTSLAVCSLDYLSVCLFVGLSVCLSVRWTICLSVCSLDYLSV